MKKLIMYKYYAPTNTRGSRIKIIDTYTNESVFIPFDYSKIGLYDMVISYLKEINNYVFEHEELLGSYKEFGFISVEKDIKINKRRKKWKLIFL